MFQVEYTNDLSKYTTGVWLEAVVYKRGLLLYFGNSPLHAQQPIFAGCASSKSI